MAKPKATPEHRKTPNPAPPLDTPSIQSTCSNRLYAKIVLTFNHSQEIYEKAKTLFFLLLHNPITKKPISLSNHYLFCADVITADKTTKYP
jgi:hypothetical protein